MFQVKFSTCSLLSVFCMFTILHSLSTILLSFSLSSLSDLALVAACDSNESSSFKHSSTCFHTNNKMTQMILQAQNIHEHVSTNTTIQHSSTNHNHNINHNLVSFSLSGVSQLCIASILPFCSSACLTVSPVSPVILLFLISEHFPPSSQLGINLSKVIQGVILFDFWPLLATKLVVGIFSFFRSSC